MVAGEATGEELVEEGVAEAFGGGDDLFGALDGLVDGVEHGGDGPAARGGPERYGKIGLGRSHDVRGIFVPVISPITCR